LKKGIELKISVILAHPDQESFNHAIAGTAVAALRQNGHEVKQMSMEYFPPKGHV